MAFAGLLPDIAKTRTDSEPLALQWVGMEGIAVPLTLNSGDGSKQTVAAKAKVHVSLDDPVAKGIHMSRIHAALNQLATMVCDKHGLDTVLEQMVASQRGISQNASISLAFDLLLNKQSLLSDTSGFQSYPVEIHGRRLNGTTDYSLTFTIQYSSTCPCSAALARQLTADVLDDHFPSSTIDKQDLLSWIQTTPVATPHSQRSYAYLNLSLGDQPWPSLSSFVAQVEETIGTPVQTMVKRRDEQEFARLNGDNLMFCEDAARRIKAMLEESSWVIDYWFKVEHRESLHAHNAVVIDRKFPNRDSVDLSQPW